MADEKWISGLARDMPAHEAARKVLTLRLGLVHDRLPGAAFHAEDDIEHVHQLRVGTRRAGAALRIFAVCLPGSLYKKMRRILQTLRRSAGEARDWDVFLEMLQTRLIKVDAKKRRGLDLLLGFAHGQRVLAQEHLQQSYYSKADKFDVRVEQVLQSLGTNPKTSPSLSELAVPMLSQLLQELDTAARGDLQQYESLHKVRILGKQVRYAMELFDCCFAPEFRHRFYPAIVEMQEILGLANDSHMACLRLNALRSRLMNTQVKQWPHYQQGIDVLVRFHERRLPEQRRKFEKWWQEWLSSGAEEAFVELVHEQKTI